MEAWQKGAPAVKKMTKAGQANYFKKFPDRVDWFRKNHPDMAHFDTSAKQGSIQKIDKVKREREELSLLTYGATRGTATGGAGGNADQAPRDTIAPMSRDMHSKVQQARRESEAAAKPPKPEKKPAAAEPPKVKKPLTQDERLRAIAAAVRNAAAKRDAQFNVPTLDPDDRGHDDYVRDHYGMHQYSEEVEQKNQSKESTSWYPRKGFPKEGEYGYDPNPGLEPQESDKDADMDVAYKKYNEKHAMNLPNARILQVSNKIEKVPVKETSLEEGKMKSHAADTDDNGHDDHDATLAHAVKMAKGVAFDKRYKGGNMSGAVRAIRAIGKKFGMHELEDHPEVNSALRRANEEFEQIDERKSSDPKGIAYKITAASHAANPSYGPHDPSVDPKTNFGAGATRSSALAGLLAARQIKKSGGNPNDPEHIETISKAIHGSPEDGTPQGWSKHALTSPNQTPEQQARRSKLTVGYDKLSHEEKEKDRQIARVIANRVHSVREEVEQVEEGNNMGKKYDEDKHLRGKTNKELESLIKFWNAAIEKRPDHATAKDQLAKIRAIRAERIGKMKEEVEQVDEAEYMGKGNHRPGWMLRADPKLKAKFDEIKKRKKLMNKYAGKTGEEIKAMQKEEVEYIEERLSKKDPASTWISHFVGSENPMFSGKTKKERINMALGAYYKAKRAAPKNEEVEIDESSHEGRTPESPEETELAKHHGDVVKARIKSARNKRSED